MTIQLTQEERTQIQEWFNTAAKGLIEQGCRSENDETCLYRGGDGLKCGVGFLIPDDKYDPEMDSESIQSSIHSNPKVQSVLGLTPCVYDDHKHVRDNRLKFLVSLQHIHDRYMIEAWETELYSLGESYGLDTSILETL